MAKKEKKVKEKKVKEKKVKAKKEKKDKNAPVLCPSCGGEVPRRTKKCPHCGAKIKKKHNLRNLIIMAVVLAAALVAVALLTKTGLLPGLKKDADAEPVDNSPVPGSIEAPAGIFEEPETGTVLVGTNMYMDGFTGASYRKSGQNICELITDNGTFALLTRTYTPAEELEKVAEEDIGIRAYFRYLGYSDIFEMPSGALLAVEVYEEEEDEEDSEEEDEGDGDPEDGEEE